MELQVVPRRQNADDYNVTLEESSCFTEEARLSGKEWIFQQDNAAIHTARRSKIFFQANNIRLLDHPPCSPDLNPIENI